MIELIPRRTGMAEVKTSRKGVAATPISKKTAAITAKPNSIPQRAAIDMKGAVKAAIACVEGFFPEAKDILLEEVEFRKGRHAASPNGGTPGSPKYVQNPMWRVVISFKSGKPGTLSDVMGGDPRLFRQIFVERDSGEISSIGAWGR
jgi:hypothetical protein